MFNSQSQIQLGGKWNPTLNRVERPFRGVLAGLVYNGLRPLDLAADGNKRTKIQGDVRVLESIPFDYKVCNFFSLFILLPACLFDVHFVFSSFRTAILVSLSPWARRRVAAAISVTPCRGRTPPTAQSRGSMTILCTDGRDAPARKSATQTPHVSHLTDQVRKLGELGRETRRIYTVCIHGEGDRK